MVDSSLFSDVTDLASYIPYTSPSSILMIKNIAHRAVIIAQASVFDLKSSKFYLVLRARRYSLNGVWGNLLYTQDQAHFDLFIFFAVFFAAFFLGLATALVIWRLRTLYSERRHDRVQMMELLKMSKRPFTTCSVFWDYESKDDHDPWPICFQNVRKKPATVATFLVRMPGGRQAPVKIAFASALLWNNPKPKSVKSQESAEAADSGQVTKRKQRYLLSGRCRVQPSA